MTTVRQHYGITGPVDFIDVHIENDNRLFVDPRAIRLQPRRQPFVSAANRCTKSFFDEITRCVRGGTPSAAARGLQLLKRFNEPKETRLGLSQVGYDGHGGSDVVGEELWRVLSTDLEAFIRISVLKYLEDIPLFVDGIDRDITSDLTTRIIFEPLADFTLSMVQRHPEFTKGRHIIGTFERQVWKPSSRSWADVQLDLPVPDGRPLVLVPRDWARPVLLMSAGRFYEKTVLDYAQLERAMGRSKTTGKLILPRKKDLKRQQGLARGRDTNATVTLRAYEHEKRDLLEDFREFVDAKYRPLDDDVLGRKLRLR